MKKRAPEEKLLLVPACQSKQGETLLERRQDNGKENRFCDNADRALLAACNETGAVVGEYTVAPCYMSLRERGAHEWILEFEREPDSRGHFAEALDRELRAVNSDYDAKRRTTLERQRLTVVGHGRFLAWMRARGKNKVPRLVNDRRVADEILAFGGETK